MTDNAASRRLTGHLAHPAPRSSAQEDAISPTAGTRSPGDFDNAGVRGLVYKRSSDDGRAPADLAISSHYYSWVTSRISGQRMTRTWMDRAIVSGEPNWAASPRTPDHSSSSPSPPPP